MLIPYHGVSQTRHRSIGWQLGYATGYVRHVGKPMRRKKIAGLWAPVAMAAVYNYFFVLIRAELSYPILQLGDVNVYGVLKLAVRFTATGIIKLYRTAHIE